jgi:hypothetical protein
LGDAGYDIKAVEPVIAARPASAYRSIKQDEP